MEFSDKLIRAVGVLVTVTVLAACAAVPVATPVATPESDADAAAIEVEPQATAIEAAPDVPPVAAEPAADPAGQMPEVPPEPKPRYNAKDVLWIQERLLELGYYDGRVDGAVGKATRSAIRAYQEDQGVTPDGQPTSALREFMWRNGG